MGFFAGHIADGSNGDIALDHYNRYQVPYRDASLLFELNYNDLKFTDSINLWNLMTTILLGPWTLMLAYQSSLKIWCLYVLSSFWHKNILIFNFTTNKILKQTESIIALFFLKKKKIWLKVKYIPFVRFLVVMLLFFKFIWLLFDILNKN